MTMFHTARATILISLTGSALLVTLALAWLLATLTFFALTLSFAVWKPYTILGGRLPARLAAAAERFGMSLQD